MLSSLWQRARWAPPKLQFHFGLLLNFWSYNCELRHQLQKLREQLLLLSKSYCPPTATAANVVHNHTWYFDAVDEHYCSEVSVPWHWQCDTEVLIEGWGGGRIEWNTQVKRCSHVKIRHSIFLWNPFLHFLAFWFLQISSFQGDQIHQTYQVFKRVS